MGPLALPGGLLGGACWLMDVIENLPDDIRLGDCCDDAQLATALGTVLWRSELETTLLVSTEF